MTTPENKNLTPDEIKELGDLIEAHKMPNGKYNAAGIFADNRFVKFRGRIDPDQLWFWTHEWQAGEREADEDMKAGRYESFEDFDNWLDELRAGSSKRLEELYKDDDNPGGNPE